MEGSSMATKNKLIQLIFSAVLFSLLSACGGGKTSNTTNNNSPQPHNLTAKNMQEMHKLSSNTDSRLKVVSNNDSITITYTADNISSADNFQFFLHADNDTSLGIQQSFVWDKPGAEYMIENGTLYKSRSNDSRWNWRAISSELSYSVTNTSISMTINKSLLDTLAPQIFVGFMERDSNWQVKSFYPESGTIAAFNIDNELNDTEAPVLTLNGADVMVVNKSTLPHPNTFHDPSAIAFDNIDGDVSNNIVTTSNVDINNIGTYKVTYTVSDAAGNTASKSRAVTVVDGIDTGFSIDGDYTKWIYLRNMLEGFPTQGDPLFKVWDTPTYLYFYIQKPNMGENTQIFIDTDNDAATGLQFFGGDWGNAGIDYMVENRTLFRSKNNDFWSWDTASPITYFRKGNTIEFSIRKTALHNLGDKINVGFVNRDANWNIIGDTYPENSLAGYRLRHPETVQIPEEVYTALCSNPNQLQRMPMTSFENGIEINGKRYFSEQVNDQYFLKVEDLTSGNIEEIQTFYSHHPYLSSTSGAVYVTGWLSPAPSVRLARKVYRLTENNDLVKITIYRKHYSLGGLAYTPASGNTSVKDIDFFTRGSARGTKKLNLYTYEESLHNGFIERTRYMGPVNSASFSDTKVERLQTYYHNGQYYYAFTPGQLLENGNYTHIGKRIIKKSAINPYDVDNIDIGGIAYCNN